MNIVGLGQAGCNIADRFGEQEEYRTYKIDSSEYTNQINYYQLKQRDDFQDYEKHSCDLREYFKSIDDEVYFAVAGSGDTSGASLWILEQLKRYKPNILYVQPDLELLSGQAAMKERILRGVLQEYARSGLFETAYLVDNMIVENFLGDIPVAGYYDGLNDIIVSTFHMINVFENTEPLIGTIQKPQESSRIATIGVASFESGEENLFYPFDLVREKAYYYAINKEKLESDGSLIKKIKTQIKSKMQDNVRVSYGIFPTNYEDDYIFCKAYTSKVQLEKEEEKEENIS